MTLATNVLNSSSFWSGSAPLDLDQDLFVFNGYSLHNTAWTVRVRNSNHDDVGNIQLDTFNSPRIDWGGVLGHYYRAKDITLEITLKSTTSTWLNTLIDTFKENTRQTEGWLDVKVNGEVRRCKASITNLKFWRQYFNISFVSTVQITFRTMWPHRQKKDAESVTYASKTATFQEEITNTGTVGTEAIYYFIFGSGISWTTSVAITTGDYTLTVSESISDSDVLIVNGEEKTATLNWTAVDYTGVFSELEVGANPITFTINGTFTVDITAIYTKRYK